MEPFRATCFRLVMPLHFQEEEEEQQAKSVPDVHSHGKNMKTILNCDCVIIHISLSVVTSVIYGREKHNH